MKFKECAVCGFGTWKLCWRCTQAIAGAWGDKFAKRVKKSWKDKFPLDNELMEMLYEKVIK